ncbi:hypothetical protein E4T56_gene14666 [Termitomyces sp. T112]|nr:hypothetical protein E4T56_gene14666 [Termitomyces sp. T112]
MSHCIEKRRKNAGNWYVQESGVTCYVDTEISDRPFRGTPTKFENKARSSTRLVALYPRNAILLQVVLLGTWTRRRSSTCKSSAADGEGTEITFHLFSKLGSRKR